MGAVGVEKAADVSAEVLDDLKSGYRSLRDDLRGALECGDRGVGVEVHRYTLPDEEQRAWNAERHVCGLMRRKVSWARRSS
jgi:hypothetical protein